MYLFSGIPRGFRNLWKNRRASFNSILIVASSLAVLGMIALLYLNVVHISQVWLSNTTVSLFLTEGLSAARRERILDEVRKNPIVRNAVAISPKSGLRALAAKLGANHNVLTDAELQGLPYTIDFEVLVDHRKKIGAIAKGFGRLAGVQEVVYAERVIDKVQLFFDLTKGLGIFFSTLILISFCFMIANATRLSLHSRRQEIEILHMAGATRGFIRSAFVIEGILIATIGWAVAIGLVWFSFRLLIAGLTWNEFTEALRDITIFFTPEMLGASLIVIAGLGAGSSHLSVTRVLRSIEP